MGISRIAVLGHGGVGKTCLIRQYINGKFTGAHNPTLEDNYRHLIPLPDGSSQIVEIIDTAGTLSFPAMRRLSIESAQCFIVVYAKGCDESVSSAREILDEIYEIKSGQAPVMLVANKSDVATTDEVENNMSTDEDSDYDDDVNDATSSPLTYVFRALSQVKRKNSPAKSKKCRRKSSEDRENGNVKKLLTEVLSDPLCRVQCESPRQGRHAMVMRSASLSGKSRVTISKSDPTAHSKLVSVNRSHSDCHTRPIQISRSDSNGANKSRSVNRSHSACHTRPHLITRSEGESKSTASNRSETPCHDDLFASYNCHSQCVHTETSAKLNKNVDNVFRELAAKMYFLNQVDDSRGWSKRLSTTLSRGLTRSVSASNFHSVKIVSDTVANRRATTNVPPIKVETKRFIRDIMRSGDTDKKTCLIM